jgi:hypothetical protein
MVADLPEVNLLLKEASVVLAGEALHPIPTSAIMAVPLFETIGDLKAAPAIMADYSRSTEIARDFARGYQEVMIGYSTATTRRLPDLDLVAARLSTASDRCLRAGRDAAVPRPRRAETARRRLGLSPRSARSLLAAPSSVPAHEKRKYKDIDTFFVTYGCP